VNPKEVPLANRGKRGDDGERWEGNGKECPSQDVGLGWVQEFVPGLLVGEQVAEGSWRRRSEDLTKKKQGLGVLLQSETWVNSFGGGGGGLHIACPARGEKGGARGRK